MTQAPPKLVNFKEFIEWYPGNGIRYELHDGVIIEMPPPTGEHENVVGFLAIEIAAEAKRLELPYRIPKTAFVKPHDSKSAYSPDILLLNHKNLVNELLWKKESTVSQAASIPLVIEVVSTNWRDDYYKKLADYELMGIPEYWVVDYAALGGMKFIGNPKQSTVSLYQLVGEEYQVTKFTGNSPIISPTFPNLSLTAQQIFDAAF
jgi:Uma2 family endonuclease